MKVYIITEFVVLNNYPNSHIVGGLYNLSDCYKVILETFNAKMNLYSIHIDSQYKECTLNQNNEYEYVADFTKTDIDNDKVYVTYSVTELEIN